MFRAYLAGCLIFISFFTISNINGQVKQDTSVKKLLLEIEKLKNEVVLKNAKWGICVITADSGKTVAAYNDSLGLIPASTMKAINTAAALSTLGTDFTFKTFLEYDGSIDNEGILHGNIYIRGGGDPTLGSPRIDTMNDIKYLIPKWVSIIKRTGIKKIDGFIVGDASIYEDSIAPSSWLYEDMGNYYGAGACGLTFHENSFTITLKPGIKYKDSVKIIGIDPFVPNIQLINNIKTGTIYSGDNVYVYGRPFENIRTLVGSLPKGNNIFIERASLPDPALLCSYSLYKALTDSGVLVRDSYTTLKILKEKSIYKNNFRTVFYKHISPTLDTIVYYTNICSINTYAENILKMEGYIISGSGSFQAGTSYVTDFWKNKNVNLKGFTMKDGSGLSSANKVSPRQLAEIMKAFIGDKYFDAFYNTLPVAGKSGSISLIFKGSQAENNLHAKSGYMRGLRSYTGYVYNKKNKFLTFGIIVNNHTATPQKMQSLLEKIMVLISETEW